MDKINRNNAWRIFHTQFLVDVQQIAMINPRYLEEFGLMSSGDAGIDARLQKSTTSVYLTINSVVEIRRKGYAVAVRGNYDLMYEIIVGHIHDWLDILQMPFIYTPPPDIVDMQDLEFLAQDLYPYVVDKKLRDRHMAPKQEMRRTYLSINGRKGNVAAGEIVEYSPLMNRYVELMENRYGLTGLEPKA